MLKKLNNKKGFTLMEMLIVVAIIAVLVAIAIPVFNNSLTKSKEAADVANIRAAYAEYQVKVISGDTATWTKPDGLYFEETNHGYSYDEANKTITYKTENLTNPADNNSKTFTWTFKTIDDASVTG